MEKQVEAFYRRLARKVLDPAVRNLCLLLAHEETQHFGLIENMLTRWKPSPPSRNNLEAMHADCNLRGLFLSPPGTDATKKEIIEYAIHVDKKILKIYSRFEGNFTSEWKIRKLQLIMAEKTERVIKLQKMLAKV
jgi:rubrerythrin